MCCVCFFFSSRRRHTRCALVTGVQTCALPICFREDLYFRLNVVNIQLPPLRQRPQDIPTLAQHFAAKYSEANGLPRLDVTPQALELLMAHGWRGNVRELENTMHRAVLLAQDGRIGPEAIMLTGQALNPAPQAAPAPGATAAAAATAGVAKRLARKSTPL